MTAEFVAPLWLWIGFIGLIMVLLTLDLRLSSAKHVKDFTTHQAAGWVVGWVSLALLFNGFLWIFVKVTTMSSSLAWQKALEFLSGYLIEQSLAIDNLFVFIMIFKYFSIPSLYQRRVLFYGIWGAIVLRFIMITMGIWLVSYFHWILYVFGVVLLVSGIKLLLLIGKESSLEKNRLLRWISQHLRVTQTFHEQKFFVYQNKLLYCTPLFVALVFIEITDVVFAIDSIPAIFAITLDPFIVFSSNIFAILGLRAFYFLIAGMIEHFHYLKYGIALILIFIGCKMLLAYWYQIPTVIALGVIASLLTVSILLSLRHKSRL